MTFSRLSARGVGLGAIAFLARIAQADYTAWRPANGPLATRWAKDVSPDKALPEYPRPQLVRADWMNLNGLWDYTIAPRPKAGGDHAEAPTGAFAGKILVPFPIESALSGVMKTLDPDSYLDRKSVV